MKTNIIRVAFLLAAVATVVSCQKETPNTSQKLNNSYQSHYQPPQVDDMNAYLKGFKQKMQTRGNDEAMELENAAWHLSSIANYDFGDVTSNYSKIHYDTLCYAINIVEGKVLVSDLNTLYNTISNDIETLFQSLDFENKHIRFINADISDDGDVVVSIMVTRDWVDHQWYFNDSFELVEILDQYYSDDSTYYLNGNFEAELKRVLDILTGHVPNPQQSYFVYNRTTTMMYYDYSDPYSWMNHYGSRIFADLGHPETMTMDEMYYYTDSYAGLGTSLLGREELIIDWNFSGILHSPVQGYYNTYHIPSINIGKLFISNPDNPGDQ